MKSKPICLLLLINLCVNNADGDFLVVSTSPSKLEEKLSNDEPQISTVVQCENSSKQIVKLLEETKEKLQLLDEIIERQEKTELRIAQMEEYLLGQAPRDCKEIQLKKSNTSGVYGIQPANAGKPFMVWCDMETRGGGWVYLLNRFDGSVDFSQNWIDYKRGFGNIRGEFWLGLEHLYELTSSKKNELLIELFDWEGGKNYAIYSDLKVGSEAEGYMLQWFSHVGNAGGGMNWANRQKFSTVKCSDAYLNVGGGWWYKSCDQGKLTGKYLNGTVSSEGKGIYWKSDYDRHINLKAAKMMIRPME